MAMGYEGVAFLKVDTLEDMALCTGASVPKSRVRLESGAAYGGQIKTPVPEIAIGTPKTYDWTAYDGSIDVELTKDFFDRQIKPWMFNRQKAAVVTIQSRDGNLQRFDKCYWNSISISASDGGAVTASIGFVAMVRNSYSIGGDYIGNKVGDEYFCDTQSFNVPDPLNPGGSNNVPIPYWNTQVKINSVVEEFVTWTIDFSQEVVKFFACEDNANPVEPKFVAVGPMTVSFSGDFMFVSYVEPAASFTIQDTILSLDVLLDPYNSPSELKFEDLELSTATDALQSPDSLVPIAVEYAAYTIAV